MNKFYFYVSVGSVLLSSVMGSQVSAHQNHEPVAVVKISEQPNVALTELRAKLAKFERFSAQFKQDVFDAKGQKIQSSQGEMQVQQPNQFRWQTYEPDESLIVSDGQVVWIHNTFVEQVTAMDLDKTVQQSPLWLIANQSDQSWSQFNVSLSERGYAIVPKDVNSLTKRIIIRFNQDVISQLVIEDSQGQSSEFNLTNFNSAPKFSPQLFDFVMPQDVDFDDQREAK